MAAEYAMNDAWREEEDDDDVPSHGEKSECDVFFPCFVVIFIGLCFFVVLALLW